MLVNFHNDWFGPDMKLYRVSNNPQQVEDILRDQLPESAAIDNGKGEFLPRGPINAVSGSDGEKNAVPEKTDTVVTKK